MTQEEAGVYSCSAEFQNGLVLSSRSSEPRETTLKLMYIDIQLPEITFLTQGVCMCVSVSVCVCGCVGV